MSGCVSIYAVKQTPSVSSGIEEVVDCVEEEDEEAEDGKDSIWIHGIPGQWTPRLNFRLSQNLIDILDK